MARGQAAAASAVSGGRRVLLLLRPRGADGALPSAAAAAASRDRSAPPSPVRRCLGDWQGLAAPSGSRAAVSGSAGWGRRVGGTGGDSCRCRRNGERDVSISASSLQSKGNISLLGNRRLFFDTHALVCLLEENGFTTQQSEVIVSALVKIMDNNLDMIYKDMVTKVQQEIALQQVMSHIGGVKKDMIILEKSEFSALRSENEKIKLELQQIKKQVMDEITKVRADNKLHLNLEKSRVKELYSLNERKLLEMRTEVVELHAQQDRALTQTDRKIDTEVADLKTMLESHKLDNIKYLAGSVFTCLTVALGFYRLWI
ncbi:mitochondrial calcium uniporter regulator 1 [Indicator indicator]|uniref:mitochondrial calcium uniporter regulator 1 n=1 Tax=Indicator indicator TaxID=1002788 RepID=UPI0023DFCA83|nr:mitochondrial calcium uniporter regulator 1 [Indicator indicator]